LNELDPLFTLWTSDMDYIHFYIQQQYVLITKQNQLYIVIYFVLI